MDVRGGAGYRISSRQVVGTAIQIGGAERENDDGYADIQRFLGALADIR